MTLPEPRIAPRLRATLGPLVAAGVCEAAEVAVTEALTDDDTPPQVTLAIALATTGLRFGHSCLDLDRADELCAGAALDHVSSIPSTSADPGAREPVDPFGLPTAADWIDALASSPMVELVGDGTSRSDRPLVLDRERGRLWLARYAFFERDLAERLIGRAARAAPARSLAEVERAASDVFGAATATSSEQVGAVVHALSQSLCFVVGGPGTGKTTTVARLVRAATELGISETEIALAAPTGKAADRLNEVVGGTVRATTVHALLGIRPGITPTPGARTIPHRLVIVDETSMVDLAMMARLVGAVGDDAHLVLVGDPDQLVSVEVGSVLRDVVEAAAQEGSPLHDSVARLAVAHRQDAGGPVHQLAAAIRDGNAEEVLALLGDPSGGAPGDDDEALRLVAPDDPGGADPAVAAVRQVVQAAAQGDVAGAISAARGCRVLTAARHGDGGLDEWTGRLRAAVGFRPGEWRVGRPVIVTRNDPANGLSNGDTGIAVADPDMAGRIRVAFAHAGGHRLLSPTALADFEDWWAMTIHKSQGSEYERVIVSLPEVGSPLLVRELLYTAVTRARTQVRIVGRPETVIAAVENRATRASGLTPRLDGSAG